MKAEFVEILKQTKELLKVKRNNFICIAILSQVYDKVNAGKSSYYESSLYEILSEGYFKTGTLSYKLKSFIGNSYYLYDEDYRKLRILWIDFFISHILSIPNGVEIEKSILDAAGKATTSLICFIKNGGLEE